MLTRRQFLQTTAVTLGFAGLRHVVGAELADAIPNRLVPDPAGILDLPEGFSYRIISRWRDEMDDGLLVPGLHDGMAAFPGPDGLTILMRNHEVLAEHPTVLGAFGERYERLDRIDRELLYDAGHGAPLNGGVTSIVYDTRNRRVVRHNLALAGTAYNCAGGATPWGTWLTCEEWHHNPSSRCERAHGYVFEVPVGAELGLQRAVALPALGRMRHEAVTVDPRSEILYLTEDLDDGLFYRFVPATKGRLLDGGRLQALAVRGYRSVDLRNWSESPTTMRQGTTTEVEWIDLDGVDTPDDDLRHRGFKRGAARFARAEGIWFGTNTVFFACTTGGAAKLGQIWRYRPSAHEGTALEGDPPGALELFIESEKGTLVRNADNITMAPNGDLFVCEDGEGRDRLVRITPGGQITHFAANQLDTNEFCGACFSPDGSTLFVNTQGAGLTFAITGPWRQRTNAAPST